MPPESEQQTSAVTLPPEWMRDLIRLAGGVKRLFGAQLRLLHAEWVLARHAVVWVLISIMAVIVVAFGLGLTLLGLIGVGLAHWLGSWAGALVVLSLLQILCLGLALWLFRKSLYWMSFPATREEWHAMVNEAMRPSSPDDPQGKA